MISLFPYTVLIVSQSSYSPPPILTGKQVLPFLSLSLKPDTPVCEETNLSSRSKTTYRSGSRLPVFVCLHCAKLAQSGHPRFPCVNTGSQTGTCSPTATSTSTATVVPTATPTATSTATHTQGLRCSTQTMDACARQCLQHPQKRLNPTWMTTTIPIPFSIHS